MRSTELDADKRIHPHLSLWGVADFPGAELDLQKILGEVSSQITDDVFLAPGWTVTAAEYGMQTGDYSAIPALVSLCRIKPESNHTPYVMRNRELTAGFAEALAGLPSESYSMLRNYEVAVGFRGMDIFSLRSLSRMYAYICWKAGDLDSAHANFSEAHAFLVSAGYRPELARTCTDYSEFLFETDAPDDREKATELQDEAIAIATELGMKPLVERVLAKRKILKA